MFTVSLWYLSAGAQDSIVEPVHMQVRSFPFKKLSFSKVQGLEREHIVTSLKLKYCGFDSAVLVRSEDAIRVLVRKDNNWLISEKSIKAGSHRFSISENTGPVNKSELIITEHDEQTHNDVFMLVNIIDAHIMYIETHSTLILTTTGW